MSVVAGKVFADKIIMAADSIISRGWSKETQGSFSKMEKINGMVIGGVGTAEESSLMWHYINTHKPSGTAEKDVLDFVIEFYKWKKDLTGDGSVRNEYLMAFEGKLFNINGMFVREVLEYYAIGAGMDYANAALYLDHSPEEAVKAACALCCYVAEPIIQFEMLKHDSEKKTNDKF